LYTVPLILALGVIHGHSNDAIEYIVHDLTSYWCNYGSILHHFLHIYFGKYYDLMSLKVIETGTIRYPASDFLLEPYSNFVSIMHRFFEKIAFEKYCVWPWNPDYG